MKILVNRIDNIIESLQKELDKTALMGDYTNFYNFVNDKILGNLLVLSDDVRNSQKRILTKPLKDTPEPTIKKS